MVLDTVLIEPARRSRNFARRSWSLPA